MTSTVMLGLGGYYFCISTAAYEELSRDSAWRWASHERVGAAPLKQFVGPGDDTITMRGSIYPHFTASQNGLEQLTLMRAEASRGKPLLMVDGTGRIWGLYCIESIRETQKTFWSNGAPRCIEFDLSLTAYGELSPEQNAAAGILNGVRTWLA